MPRSFTGDRKSWQNVNGRPLNNGYLYIGVATLDPKLNPKSIYSDSAQTVPITNPVRLDSYGQTPTDVHVTSPLSYRVSDEFDTQIVQNLNYDDTVTPVSGDVFPAGTRMLFQQELAPTGWTRDVTAVDERAIRVVDGAGWTGSGGTIDFTTAFANNAVGGTAITEAQMPAHTHTTAGLSASNAGSHSHVVTFARNDSGTNTYNVLPEVGGGSDNLGETVPNVEATSDTAADHTHTISGTIDSTGGDGTHTHTLQDMSVRYLDVIVAVKD